MTFLKWYGLGAVGLTMMVTAVGIQWSLFTESFFDQLVNNLHNWHYVPINIYSLLNTLYAISAVLISFGAVIGKVSPLQLLAMTIIELVFHSLNYRVLMIGVLGVVDMGGTYVSTIAATPNNKCRAKITSRSYYPFVSLPFSFRQVDHMFGAYFGLAVAFVLGKPTAEPEMGESHRIAGPNIDSTHCLIAQHLRSIAPVTFLRH